MPTSPTIYVKVDLDAFLTQLESKLRCPFSSLDFCKAVIASSQTGSASHYLANVLSVLPRAEKVTQMKILTGLLGLEPSAETYAAIRHIVEAAQEAPVYEEWVRVVAGLVQGILFENDFTRDDDAKYTAGQAEASGQEAKLVLSKTCADILDRVRNLTQETSVVDEETENFLVQSDADPLFVPYRYDMLRPDMMEQVIPELKAHHHFLIDISADILLMDAKVDFEKAKEEQEHEQAGLHAATPAAPEAATQKHSAVADFPGFRDQSSKPKAAIVRPKSSMFMPTKLPAAAAAAKRPLVATGMQGAKPSASGGLQPVVKPVLHQRKAGAAQALLAKGRRARLVKSGAAAATTTAQATAPPIVGRTVATNRGGTGTKMKLMDITEVQGLETKKQEAAAAVLPTRDRKVHQLAGNKRSKPDTTAGTRIEKLSRVKKRVATALTVAADTENAIGKSFHAKSKPPPPAARAAAAPTAAEGALASAALLAYQSRMAAQPPQTPAPAAATVAGSSGTKQQDWRKLLQQKSNRLSEDDRLRVQQFFLNNFNPTPGRNTYKMKLHEDRTHDAKTGDPVKETYYLELDYDNFTSTQSKKVKRYNEDH